MARTRLGQAFPWFALAVVVAITRLILSLRESRILGELANRDSLTGLLNHRAFHAALERSPERRAAFLNDACAHDPTLRAEVDALSGAILRG